MMPRTHIDRLSWKAILGLAEPKDRDWPLVRAAQLRDLNSHSILPVAAHFIVTGLVALQYWSLAPLELLIGWLVFNIALAISIMHQLTRNAGRVGGAPRRAVSEAVFHATMISLSWSIPLIAFPSYGSPAQSLGFSAAAIALIGATPVVMAAIPLAGLLVCLITGTALAATMHLIGFDSYASAAIAYAFFNAIATTLHGRKTLTRLRREIARNSQDEVVDMLLRQNTGKQGDWLWHIDGRKCLLDPSPRFAEAAGVEPGALEGMPLLRLLGGPAWDGGKVDEKLRDFATRLQRGRSFSDFLLPVKIAGKTRWWKISGSPQVAPEGHIMGYRGVMADVTESEAAERRTHHMAHFDALTGLANRSHINQLLQDQIMATSDNGTICAFLLIDLDRFKAINDTLGHPIGDELLKMVGTRLESLTQTGDRCGRLGGDEFAMVIAEVTSSQNLDLRAREIIRRLSQPYEVDGHMLHIGASVGSAIYPKDGRSAPTLLRNADLALYRAKESGRGVHESYEPMLSRKAERRRAIELALRKAIERDEFSLVYQPVMTLGSNQPAGFEALLRWRNEQLGMVPPSEFLPIAEETRLIDSIGEWVFHEACSEAADWPEDYRLAINLSAGQLRNPRLAETICAALRQAGLAPERLEIETTEAVLNTDHGGAFETFDALHARGVTVALDDFGSGYSTLSMIGQARFASIKIDKGFIHSAESGSEASTAVIKAVIAMADSLGIATIVEGIETDDQLALAASLGCRQAQGFYLGKPVPAETVRGKIGTRPREAAA